MNSLTKPLNNQLFKDFKIMIEIQIINIVYQSHNFWYPIIILGISQFVITVS